MFVVTFVRHRQRVKPLLTDI